MYDTSLLQTTRTFPFYLILLIIHLIVCNFYTYWYIFVNLIFAVLKFSQLLCRVPFLFSSTILFITISAYTCVFT